MSPGKPYIRQELKDALEWAGFVARSERQKRSPGDYARQRDHSRRMADRERVFAALLAEGST
jgi:hypothetical protein